jgi:tryptophan synthase alpha chain
MRMKRTIEMSAETNRIHERLAILHSRKEKALACFLTAGFPNIDATVPLVMEMEKGGADIIEIGMPFSDPLADGPVIQHSSHIALNNGVTLETVLSYVQSIRCTSVIPIVLMGYLNPILNYGAEKFFKTAADAGVDGIILPDLPLEESGRYKTVLKTAGLANILLVTPTTPLKRISLIDRASSGFLYCVSSTGVTGSTQKLPGPSYIRSVKKHARKNPVLVGFGIKTPADARRISRYADGVIVGSALVQKLAAGASKSEIRHYITGLKEALSSRVL